MNCVRIKSLVLGLLLLRIVLVSSAQERIDLPYYYCAMNGTIFNQPPYGKVRFENEEFSSQEAANCTALFQEMHPDCIVIEPSSKLYNCHGFAYSVFQGGEKLIIEWNNDLCSYNNSNIESFVQIPVNSVQPGDIATIINPNDNGTYSIHSSIVVNEDTLISKWGNQPLFKHYKYAPWIVQETHLGTDTYYVYYRRNINPSNQISGPYIFNGTGIYTFYPDILVSSCTWSIEPAAMFQVSSGTGYTANLSYKTPFEYLAPKATITFTFSYGCDNHYTVSKEFDLRIPTTTISGNAVSEGFILDANATVTVTGNIKSNKNAKTIVPVGTRLILDGGLMTNNDNNFWQGIEVWGNKNVHQYEINGCYGQGYLELKNDAVIENAKCAVELWRPEHYSTTGGIIHATDATFRNNAMAVRAVCYTNHSPYNNKETNYNGSFVNCSFVVNGDYLGTETFKKHVTLADVNGIGFLGCDFSANRSANGVHPYCIGISAYDAGFNVNSYCATSPSQPCPDSYLDRSTFTGLCAGISAASNGNHPRSFTVWGSVFTANDYGVKANSTDCPVICFNDFNIGSGAYCDYNYGVYLRNVAIFSIEENSFQSPTKSPATSVGIAVYDAHGFNDVYRNSFTNLSRANLAFGINVVDSSEQWAGSAQGLTYTCNAFSGNQRDLMVLQKGGAGDIQPLQGSSTCPAGNTFENSVFQIYNDGISPINYFYNSSASGETPNSSLLYRVTPVATTAVNNCFPHYGNGPVAKSPSEKAALESDYLAAYAAYFNLKQLYESRIDGGSTATQLADINAATPADMWQLRARLLGLSPYVSADVLTAASDRSDVFSDPVLFEILAANPDELKKDSLIDYLEHKDNPLPNYMIDMLRQVAAGATARTALESQMNQLQHDYCLAAGDIVRSNLNDSVANPEELRTWLGNMNDIAADRMAISSYLQEGDSTSAFTLANMLPELYGLEGERLADHSGYMQLIQLYQSLNSSGRTVYEMTETETAMVDSIAENGIGVSRGLAKNLRGQVLDTIMETCLDPGIPDLLEGGRESSIIDASTVNQAMGFTVSIGPNPATTWTVVDYALPAKMTKGSLVLTNALGVVMVAAELEGSQGQKVLDLRGLANGVYLYTVRCGELVQTGKLVITK